ncbi:hypothetical protein [Pseudonocardia phyllosphaerae]|uniref:hypothetical protein n=1 Tax=Pseudonocardia phyllosphaerae TaxID=3390502 RepID=UPI00397BA7F4
MTPPRPNHAPDPRDDRTRALPESTRRIPLPPTQQIPATTELLPESRPDGPTRAMRQVRARTEDGAWPAIPMLPVIRPEESDRRPDPERHRELRETVERLEHGEVPAWPEREEPDEEFRI